MKNITILVNSCDKYESVWDPFFTLLAKQWPECKSYNIVLNTETKVYNCNFLNIKTICSGTKLTWSERLKNVLKQIDTEYILYFLEDFFLREKVDNDTLLDAVKYIKSHDNVGYIGLKYSPTRNFKDESKVDFSCRFLDKDNIITINRVNSMTALWKKDWLLKLLKNHETPWEFEIYGSVRSRRSDTKVLVVNYQNKANKPIFVYDVDPEYGYAINGGKWLPKNIELFAEHGINVDFDILGIDYDLYKRANGIKTDSPKATVENKDSIREKLYLIKWYFRKLKKKTIKLIRKIRSLI